MNFLIIDTSSSYCSITIQTADGVYSDTRKIPRQHNKFLLPMISELFVKTNIDKKSLDFVTYGIGPGSFVGVRLSAAAAQAFAVGLDIPIIGFSSMFAIAKSTDTSTDKVAVVLDAKMGDIYLGLYDKSTDQTISESVYKLDEYSENLTLDYEVVGESVEQINLVPDITEFNLDTSYMSEYVLAEYNRQKKLNLLTHEVYPVYLRGRSHWKTKAEG